jgi:hypothetical protein
MTLILGMSKPEGIYMSADYRATRSGKLVGDDAIKFLTVHYPPDKTGPKALLACTGLGELPDGTPTGRWLRETLRGETEVIDRSMEHLRERLDRDVAPLGYELIVNVLVLERERRLFGGLSNVKIESGAPVLHDSFGYVMQELDGPFWFANGSGALYIADRERTLLQAQKSVVPRQPKDHMKLLATVNRRAAELDRRKTVSPFCQVSFINSDERTGPQSQTFTEQGEDVPFAMPVLLFGVDLSDMMSRFVERSAPFFRGETTSVEPDDGSIDEINEGLQRRP